MDSNLQLEQELRELKERINDLIPLVTDALRMQTICDNHEGVHSIPCLLMARARTRTEITRFLL